MLGGGTDLQPARVALHDACTDTRKPRTVQPLFWLLCCTQMQKSRFEPAQKCQQDMAITQVQPYKGNVHGTLKAFVNRLEL